MAGAPVEILSRVPLFDELDAEELQEVADAMDPATFGAGETIVGEGSVPDRFFVIVDGRAAVSIAGERRATLGPGDWFGEIALLMGSERTATITAETDLRCYGLAALAFRALVEGNPTMAWKLVGSMSDRLG